MPTILALKITRRSTFADLPTSYLDSNVASDQNYRQRNTDQVRAVP